jgi:signal transduction histidine kinase
MNPSDEGIALRCDEDGIVREVVRDALQLAERVPVGTGIVEMADPVDAAKVRNFLHELQQKRAAFDWEISVGGPAGLQTMHFAGGEIEGGFLVIVARTRGGLELLNTELMRINNEQMNALRSASREVARLNESSKFRRRGDESVYDELTQVNNELTNLQREMAKANAKLAQLNEQKNRLLGMAAHDLRSPLGAILAFSEFLQADADAGFSEEHREFIATIHSSSEFMLNLINDLLDVSSIESGQLKLNPGPGELADLVADGTINSAQAKKVFAELMANPASPREIVKRLGLAQISDVSALGTYCDEAIAANPRSVEDYRAGKTNAINALKGFVMKKSQGKANPLQVDEILKAKLSA